MFDVPEVLLLLLEPDGEDGIVAVPAVTSDLPDPSWTPDGPHGDRLYAFVDAHRDRLVEAGRVRGVVPQRIGRALASAALRREAGIGADVWRWSSRTLLTAPNSARIAARPTLF